MQNFITSNNSGINLDEILTKNLNANNEAKSAQGNDFAKVFGDVSKDKKNVQNNKKNFTADNHPAQSDKRTNKATENTKNQNISTEDKKVSKSDNAEKTQENDKKNVDSFESNNIKEELKTVDNGQTQVLSADETVQNAIDRLNQALEGALDGQLNIKDVEDIKATLESIQTKISNNEIAVSEQTQKNLTDLLDRLTTQDPKALEVKALAQDLKQLQQDIQANAYKTTSQLKLEQNEQNPTRALEINLDDTKTTDTSGKKIVQQESKPENTIKTSQVAIQASQDIKETKVTDKVENSAKDVLKQNMLDEMQVKVESVSDSSSGSTNSQNSSYTTAQDEVIKLKIENVDSNTTPVTFSLNNANGAAGAAKAIPLETAPKELNKNDILNQIGSKFEQLKDGSNTKITMTLRPNDLGRVTIEMSQSANGITTNIIAQNSQVKELLDKNIDILKQQLAQQGVNMQNVQVKTVEQNAQANLSNNNFDNKGDAKQQEQGSNQGRQQEQQSGSNRRFNFAGSNIIDNADFENNNSQTAQINTARGKISYNI